MRTEAPRDTAVANVVGLGLLNLSATPSTTNTNSSVADGNVGEWEDVLYDAPPIRSASTDMYDPSGQPLLTKILSMLIQVRCQIAMIY